jgi:hypothetical protein
LSLFPVVAGNKIRGFLENVMPCLGICSAEFWTASGGGSSADFWKKMFLNPEVDAVYAGIQTTTGLERFLNMVKFRCELE